MERAGDSFPAIALAMGVLAKSDAELTAAVLESERTECKKWLDLFDEITRQQKAYAGLAGLLKMATVRLLVPLARYAIARDAEAAPPEA